MQQLPGVGPARARRLLEHFGSVQACLNASLEDLQILEGIGPTIAEGILRTVRESSASPQGAPTMDALLW